MMVDVYKHISLFLLRSNLIDTHREQEQRKEKKRV
jgi:hypothetical protein